MSIFDNLNSEYNAWRTRYLDDQRTSSIFAEQFAKWFEAHIGAPDSYTDLGGAERKPYVEALKYVDLGDDTYELAKPDHPYDRIHRGPDGYWRYGIRVTLEINPRAFPKQSFAIPIHFIIEDKLCKMRITDLGEGKFDFDISYQPP